VPTLLRGLDTATTVDVIGGAAGAIRPLLNLYDLTHSEAALDCARACGEHILAAAEPQSTGVGWLSPAGRLPLTGFAHGAAGVSWALFKLYEATRYRPYWDAALAGIAYERSLFSPADQNWRDLRQVGAAEHAESAPCVYYWCHGSAGVGLGRVDTLAIQDDDQTRGEIASAVETTAAQGFRLDHSLCHGYASTAELMMLAAKAGVPVPPPAASSWGGAMLDSIGQNGYVTGFPLGIEIPGLMMGVAGIGYGLLRLSNPEQVPSVLLLEPPILR
jgi:lantibiotic modifying enzyme